MVGGGGVGVVKRLKVIWFGVYEKFSLVKFGLTLYGKRLGWGSKEIGKKVHHFFFDFGSWLLYQRAVN